MADTHHFDAGNLSCGDGFAAEFRRQIERIPVGDVLVTTVRDPSAKTDLPALARLMGHQVTGVEEHADGALVLRSNAADSHSGQGIWRFSHLLGTLTSR